MSFLQRNNQVIGYTIGSVFAECIATPIYLVRTNYLTTENISIKKTILNIYNANGIIGFYNAIASAIFARIASASLKYLIYSELKYSRGNTQDQIFSNMLNGCMAGLFASFFVHPIDVITNTQQRLKSVNKKMLSRKVLYAGFSQTIIRNLALYSLLFPIFDYMKYLTNDDIVLACVSTSFISTCVLQPIELLRTRYMAQQYTQKITFKSCYRGFHITYLANMLHFTIAMNIASLFIPKKQ